VPPELVVPAVLVVVPPELVVPAVLGVPPLPALAVEPAELPPVLVAEPPVFEPPVADQPRPAALPPEFDGSRSSDAQAIAQRRPARATHVRAWSPRSIGTRGT
jgi:hypothetical protein